MDWFLTKWFPFQLSQWNGIAKHNIWALFVSNVQPWCQIDDLFYLTFLASKPDQTYPSGFFSFNTESVFLASQAWLTLHPPSTPTMFQRLLSTSVVKKKKKKKKASFHTFLQFCLNLSLTRFIKMLSPKLKWKLPTVTLRNSGCHAKVSLHFLAKINLTDKFHLITFKSPDKFFCIFSILPAFLQFGLSTAHVCADWPLDWSLAVKWAWLLIIYLVAASSNSPKMHNKKALIIKSPVA